MHCNPLSNQNMTSDYNHSCFCFLQFFPLFYSSNKNIRITWIYVAIKWLFSSLLKGPIYCLFPHILFMVIFRRFGSALKCFLKCTWPMKATTYQFYGGDPPRRDVLVPRAQSRSGFDLEAFKCRSSWLLFSYEKWILRVVKLYILVGYFFECMLR